MSPHILLDTGPLVAILANDDHFHETAKRLFSKITDPFITCEAVLTEACHLLSRFHSKGAEAVLRFAEKNSLNLEFSVSKELTRIKELISRYRTVPISLADACLIRCAEIYEEPRIATFDSDFEVYRWGRNKRFDIMS